MKKIILTIVCVILMLCMFAGCSSGTAEADTEDRIMLLERVCYSNTASFIFVDRETGVMYLAAYEGGITVMVDQDGRPLIYDK